MRKAASLFVILGTQALALNATADSELDLAVGSDMVSADYHLLDETRGTLWGAGLTYNDDHSATAVSATYNVIGDAFQMNDVRTGLGLKGVVHDTFQTAISLALGGSARFEPQQLTGVGFEGQIYYAPEILNSNDAERYHEVLARVTYDVNPRAKVFAGWSDKTVKYDHATVNEVRISHTLNVGFTLTF